MPATWPAPAHPRASCGPAAARSARRGAAATWPCASKRHRRRRALLPCRRAHRPLRQGPRHRGRAGPPHRPASPAPVRAVLTALLCLALDDRPLFLTEATRLLFQQMPETSRRLLGVPGTASGERAFLAAYRRVRYCFGAICSVADPSPLPKNRRLRRAGPHRPHQADDPRPGPGCPRPAGSIHQLPDRSQRQRPGWRGTRGARRAAPGWTPPRSRCSPAAPPSGPGYAPATPTADGTSARATTANARTTREGRCGRSAGRWRPPSPPPPARPARRPAAPTSPPAWP